MNDRYIHLSPRLSCALSLVRDAAVIADIGCDHGRFSAALLQKKACRKVIATDISDMSLSKARSLIRYIGLENVDFRCGNGLSVLKENECDAIVMLGMGGTLMARILEESPLRLMGATSVILQPMRAQSDIRSYLYHNDYRITDDRIVKEGSRYYQIIRAIPEQSRQELPKGWPCDFFDIGFVSLLNKEPYLAELVEQQLKQHCVHLLTANGTDGEGILKRKIDALHQIQQLIS